MKLETQHITPYLAHKVNVKIVNKIRNYKVGQVRELSMQLFWDETRSNKTLIKPILKPLKDFIKRGLYIEHLNLETVLDESYPIDFEEGCEGDLHDYIVQWCNSESEDYHVNFIPNGIIEAMRKEHFDTNGLIKKGLAIDYNTIVSCS